MQEVWYKPYGMSKEIPEISDVLKLAREAGEKLLDMKDSITVTRKDDGSLLTNADTACNVLLVNGLNALTPDIPVIAEENTQEENQKILKSHNTFWTVDPLDVTDNYIEGRKDYSVNIALIKNGVPVLGVLLFPAHDDVYFTGDDGKAYRQKGQEKPEQLQVKSIDWIRDTPVSFQNKFAIAMRPHEAEMLEENPQTFIKTVISAGQRRSCLVASGEVIMTAEAAGFYLWDTAPAFAIVRAAGGDMRTEQGRQLPFTTMQLPAYTAAHYSLFGKLRLECYESDHKPKLHS